MRKVFLYIFVLLFMLMVVSSNAFAANFPTDKGSIILQGGFSFSSSGGELYGDDDRFIYIQVDPSISYFIAPGFVIGGTFLLERVSGGDFGMTTWGVGPQIMYFIGGNQAKSTVKGTTYPYLGAAFLYTNSSYDELSISGTLISFGGGICYMLSNAVGLYVDGNYELETMTHEEGESASGNTFVINLGFIAFLY